MISNALAWLAAYAVCAATGGIAAISIHFIFDLIGIPFGRAFKPMNVEGVFAAGAAGSLAIVILGALVK